MRLDKISLWIIVYIIILANKLFCLSINEKEIRCFEKEVCAIVREILGEKYELTELGLTFRLDGHKIRNTTINSAVVTFLGLTKNDIVSMRNNGFSFDDLREKIKKISIIASVKISAIRELLQYKIGRVPQEKRIFDQIQIEFLDGKIHISGAADLRKIPGNMLAFLSHQFSPFSAVISLQKEGSVITLDIHEAQINEQPMTPELKTQILSWLNPLWDFSKLSYPADIEEFRISSEGLFFRGFLFGK